MSNNRVRVSYTPQWSNVQAWAIKTINQNKWRYQNKLCWDPTLEPEDLLSEAYIIFVKIAEYYPRVVEQRHFFSLFKTALRNYLHDQARYMQRRRLAIEVTDDDASEADQIGALNNDGFVRAKINSVPELKAAYAIIEQNPRGLRRVFVGKHENLNMKLHRLTGVEYDFMNGFREALSP